MSAPRYPNRWTHTAVILRGIEVGPQQDRRIVPAGTRVTLWKDPARQEGEFISVRVPGFSGHTRLTNLRDVEAL